MPKLDITIDKWLPDFLPFAMPKGGLSVCKNLIPKEERICFTINDTCKITDTKELILLLLEIIVDMKSKP